MPWYNYHKMTPLWPLAGRLISHSLFFQLRTTFSWNLFSFHTGAKSGINPHVFVGDWRGGAVVVCLCSARVRVGFLPRPRDELWGLRWLETVNFPLVCGWLFVSVSALRAVVAYSLSITAHHVCVVQDPCCLFQQQHQMVDSHHRWYLDQS